MRKNLLKQLILALLLTVAMPCAKAQMAHIGDILCTDDLIVSPANYDPNIHTARGVIFYVDNTGQHGWAVARNDLGKLFWGQDYKDTSLPNYANNRQAIYDLDGYENTRILRSLSTSSNYSFGAVDYANGWYVPAIGQLNYLYGNLIDVNSSLQKVGSKLSDANYWSSTERSETNGWYLSFTNGQLNTIRKSSAYSDANNYKLNVRAVRNF